MSPSPLGGSLKKHRWSRTPRVKVGRVAWCSNKSIPVVSIFIGPHSRFGAHTCSRNIHFPVSMSLHLVPGTVVYTFGELEVGRRVIWRLWIPIIHFPKQVCFLRAVSPCFHTLSIKSAKFLKRLFDPMDSYNFALGLLDFPGVGLWHCKPLPPHKKPGHMHILHRSPQKLSQWHDYVMSPALLHTLPLNQACFLRAVSPSLACVCSRFGWLPFVADDVPSLGMRRFAWSTSKVWRLKGAIWKDHFLLELCVRNGARRGVWMKRKSNRQLHKPVDPHHNLCNFWAAFCEVSVDPVSPYAYNLGLDPSPFRRIQKPVFPETTPSEPKKVRFVYWCTKFFMLNPPCATKKNLFNACAPPHTLHQKKSEPPFVESDPVISKKIS